MPCMSHNLPCDVINEKAVECSSTATHNGPLFSHHHPLFGLEGEQSPLLCDITKSIVSNGFHLMTLAIK